MAVDWDAIRANTKTILEVHRPWTVEELKALRNSALEFVEPQEAFTCDTCHAQKNCNLVFDPYNTDGDCLAEK